MSPSNPLRILVVEDNSADVYLIEESLRQHAIPFELVRFERGEAALEHLFKRTRSEALPDVVLLDLHLPGIDGETILKAIRGERRLAGIPVVILTGACRENLGHADLSGACCIVHKSMDLDEYLRDVAHAVLKRRVVPAARN